MKKLVAVVIIITLLIVIKNLAFELYGKINFNNPASLLETELSSQKQRNKFLQEQYKYVKTNDFIEEEARKKLGLVRQGEHIVIAPSASDSGKEEIKIDNRPNWKKWWQLFF